MPLRYAEMRPVDLERAWTDGAPAIMPIGALEWHGPHLPLGLDGLVSQAFSEQLADLVGAVLLPAFYTPITTIPHPLSLEVKTATLQAVLDDTLSGLQRAGARKVCVVTGHYAQGHMIELYRAAMRCMNRYGGFLVFAASPLEPLDDERLMDHAGLYETSQLLALRPELVSLESLDSLDPRRSAILGDDPRGATAELGHQLIAKALVAWKEWLGVDEREALMATYEQRIESFRPYVDQYYKGSWEEALTTWWEQKTSEQ